MNCKKCNQKIIEPFKFCTNCGYKVDEIEISNQNHIEESAELPSLTTLNIQKDKNLNKKIVIMAVVMLFIISISSINLYKLFTSEGKGNQEPILTDKGNTEELESPKKEYDEFPVTVQEAISIAKKVTPAGRVELVSDRIRKDGNFYYEITVFTDIENVTSKLGTLYIDKETGDIFTPDIYNPANPWTKVEGVVGGSADEQYADSPNISNTPIGPTTGRDYYGLLKGTWESENENEIRNYVREGYFVTYGDISVVEGEIFALVWDKDEINELLKDYRTTSEPLVFTITNSLSPTSSLQGYDSNNFNDIISDVDIENSMIVNIKNNNELSPEQFKELIIFTSDDYKKCRVFQFITDPYMNMILKEKATFYKVAEELDYP